MSTLTLTRMEPTESSVRYEFDPPPALSGFFLDTTFEVEYGVDVGDVPESVLVVPWLANVSPLAWATGVDVELPRLDERYGESLTAVRRSLRELYPRVIRGSEVRCRELVDNEADRGDGNAAVLFSGGVDALHTYRRHRDEDPTLVSIHGFDVDLDDPDAWRDKKERVDAFARKRGLESVSVRTNMMSFMEDFMLDAHFRRHLQSDWYDAVQQGLGITGLCAPLAYAEGLDTIYMADGASETYDIKVGNHPSVVDNIAWSGTAVRSDGYEFTRQEKIEAMADFLETEDISPHTCLKSGAGNCSECEKCLRTAFGLVLAGLDPNRHGYDVDGGSFEYARDRFAGGEWRLGPAKAVMWRDLQDHARRDLDDRLDRDAPYYPEARAFFEWLAAVDVDRFEDPTNSSGFRAYELTRRLPPSPLVHSVRRQVLDVIW
ncbi:hypothetical protein [Halorussus sp. AFM4]|uniref:hypothetical protein n=1 Tax=Halorussus sp. AFM4 TaxID=3421651 RepID=UPI003EB78E2F